MNIDKLKKVIQEVNPEIMELKFGCELHYVGKKGVFLSWYDELGRVIDVLVDDLIDQQHIEEFEILGRPICLADVLLAFREADIPFSVTAIGCFVLLKKDPLKSVQKDGANIRWNLKDNNLDNQSDECKKFLMDLLVK